MGCSWFNTETSKRKTSINNKNMDQIRRKKISSCSIATLSHVCNYKVQFCAFKSRSCETQLIEFVDDLSKNRQEGRQTDILIMDFAKAFDKVNHRLLIHKLRYYGIDGKTTRWIQNWLEDRQQTVVLNGVSSEAVSVDSGVPQPQGSVLGPGFFLF
jgi:hypothetical protein